MTTIVIQNERKDAKIDLSFLPSIQSQRIILAPKGFPGDKQSCPSACLDNPTIKSFLNSGWISINPPVETKTVSTPSVSIAETPVTVNETPVTVNETPVSVVEVNTEPVATPEPDTSDEAAVSDETVPPHKRKRVGRPKKAK